MEKSSSNNSSIKLFEYEGASVRTVLIDGDVWFVAKDVCDVLGLDNVSKAIQELDDDEKSSLTISKGTSPKGGNPNMNIISESGVYALVFKSRKPEAKKFTRWVTHEVLPQVMRTGRLCNSSKYALFDEYDEYNMSAMLNWLAVVRRREDFWRTIQAQHEEFVALLPDVTVCAPDFPQRAIRQDEEDVQILRGATNIVGEIIKKKVRYLEDKETLLESLSISQFKE